jgi:hypothetical protein
VQQHHHGNRHRVHRKCLTLLSYRIYRRPSPSPPNISQQDKTPGKTYDRVIYFLIAVKAFQFCMGPILDFLDGRLLAHTLRKNEKNRLELMRATIARGDLLPGWRVTKPTLYIFGGQFILMVLTSWVVSTVAFAGKRGQGLPME